MYSATRSSCTSSGEAGDGSHLAIPLVDLPSASAEDGRVRRVNEKVRSLAHAQLRFAALELSDILPDTDDTKSLAHGVTTRGCVQKHLNALAILMMKGNSKLSVSPLARAEHRINGNLASSMMKSRTRYRLHHLLLREARNRSGLVVPLVHTAVCVNADDGRVGTVDEQPEIGSEHGDASFGICGR